MSLLQKPKTTSPGQPQAFFTVWKTSTSTAVVTSTAINSSITISASAYCTYAGFTGPLLANVIRGEVKDILKTLVQGRTFVYWVIAALVVSCSCKRRGVDDDSPLREKFLMATHLTSTVTSLSTMTSVIPYFCFTTKATACQGRRLRHTLPKSIALSSGDDVPFLEDSKNTKKEADELTGSLHSEKYFFTIRTTVTSTTIIVTTSTNRDFTVSASTFCTYTGFTGPVCG
nr:uncharacterized protein LOC113807333 [Penaeus vannamei]